MLCAGFVAGWDAVAVFFTYPDIRDSLADGDATDASWVLSVSSIVAAAVLLQAGRFADRMGHRRTFGIGASLYTVATAVAMVAPGLWVLVAARGAMAAGLAIIGPASMAILLASSATEQVSRTLGRWGLATALGGVLGPVAVSTIVEASTWRITFALQLPIGLLMVWLSRDRAADRPDETVAIRPLDSLITVGGLVLIVFPIVYGNTWGWTEARTLGSLACGLLAITVLVTRSRDRATAPLPLDLFGVRSFTLTVLISVSAGIAFFAQWLSMLLYLTDVWGWTLIHAGLFLTLMPGSMSLLSITAGGWADRVGHRRVMVPGALLYTVCFGAFWLFAGDEPNLLLLVPAVVSGGVAMATVWPGLTSAGTRSVEPHRLGVAAAMIHTTQRVGAAIGVALVVALVASGEGLAPEVGHLRAVGLMPFAGLATAVLAAQLGPRQPSGLPIPAAHGAEG